MNMNLKKSGINRNFSNGLCKHIQSNKINVDFSINTHPQQFRLPLNAKKILDINDELYVFYPTLNKINRMKKNIKPLVVINKTKGYIYQKSLNWIYLLHYIIIFINMINTMLIITHFLDPSFDLWFGSSTFFNIFLIFTIALWIFIGFLKIYRSEIESIFQSYKETILKLNQSNLKYVN